MIHYNPSLKEKGMFYNKILFTNIFFGSSQQDQVWKFEMLYFFPISLYIKSLFTKLHQS